MEEKDQPQATLDTQKASGYNFSRNHTISRVETKHPSPNNMPLINPALDRIAIESRDSLSMPMYLIPDFGD